MPKNNGQPGVRASMRQRGKVEKAKAWRARRGVCSRPCALSHRGLDPTPHSSFPLLARPHPSAPPLRPSSICFYQLAHLPVPPGNPGVRDGRGWGLSTSRESLTLRLPNVLTAGGGKGGTPSGQAGGPAFAPHCENRAGPLCPRGRARMEAMKKGPEGGGSFVASSTGISRGGA